MSVIYKYEIFPPLDGLSTKIKVVGLNSVLKVHSQDDRVFMWCEVNTHAIRECELEVYCIPTGLEFANSLGIEYIDTVFLYNGNIVFHIYYKLL